MLMFDLLLVAEHVNSIIHKALCKEHNYIISINCYPCSCEILYINLITRGCNSLLCVCYTWSRVCWGSGGLTWKTSLLMNQEFNYIQPVWQGDCDPQINTVCNYCVLTDNDWLFCFSETSCCCSQTLSSGMCSLTRFISSAFVDGCSYFQLPYKHKFHFRKEANGRFHQIHRWRWKQQIWVIENKKCHLRLRSVHIPALLWSS